MSLGDGILGDYLHICVLSWPKYHVVRVFPSLESCSLGMVYTASLWPKWTYKGIDFNSLSKNKAGFCSQPVKYPTPLPTPSNLPCWNAYHNSWNIPETYFPIFPAVKARPEKVHRGLLGQHLLPDTLGGVLVLPASLWTQLCGPHDHGELRGKAGWLGEVEKLNQPNPPQPACVCGNERPRCSRHFGPDTLPCRWKSTSTNKATSNNSEQVLSSNKDSSFPCGIDFIKGIKGPWPRWPMKSFSNQWFYPPLREGHGNVCI